jgi:hypothetical protein
MLLEEGIERYSKDLVAKYAINNKMTLNLTARYYWSYSDVKDTTLWKTTENNHKSFV